MYTAARGSMVDFAITGYKISKGKLGNKNIDIMELNTKRH